jgi:hypothetical protein
MPKRRTEPTTRAVQARTRTWAAKHPETDLARDILHLNRAIDRYREQLEQKPEK